MKWLLKRLEEPSTWAGISVLISTIAPYVQQIAHGGGPEMIIATIAAAAMAVLKAEGISP